MSGISFQVKPRSRANIRAVANGVRQLLPSATNALKFPIMEMLENTLPQLAPDFSLIIREQSEMGNNHGYAEPAKGIIALREDVYIGATDGNPRDLMTAAHELGHLLLHQDTRLMRNIDGRALPAYRDSEWQANCFAGELLVPARLVAENCSSIQDVMEQCGVSYDAAYTQTKAFRKGGLINWS